MTDRDTFHEAGHAVIGMDLGLTPIRLSVEPGAVAHCEFRVDPADGPIRDMLGTGRHLLDLDPAALDYAVRHMIIDLAGPVAGSIAERRTGRMAPRQIPPPVRDWEPRIMPDGSPEPHPVAEMLGEARPVNDEPKAKARAFQNAGLTAPYLVEWAWAEAQFRVRELWPVIQQVADALARRQSLDAAAFAAVYQPPHEGDTPSDP